MSAKLQEGIYYRNKPKIGNSFCIVTLRVNSPDTIRNLGINISRIWNRLTKLKRGIISDLDVDAKHRKGGNLTILLAFGYKLFELPGVRKIKPTSFDDRWTFRLPRSGGGGHILESSDLSYSEETVDNHMLNDEFLIQCIADNGFFTNRAAVEVWKEICNMERKDLRAPLRVSGFYTGFQRADQRNWLGFHDGVSNLESYQRSKVISVEARELNDQDKWMSNGTYMAFMRMPINLEKWEKIPLSQQEKIIGREKLTGCPLIGVDARGKPIKDSRCPVRGTSEVIDPGNERFRERPQYGIAIGNRIIQLSHIGLTRPKAALTIPYQKSSRIFRQGFEFLNYSKENSRFIPGLNFVSFQNTPESLFRSLTYKPKIALKSLAERSFSGLNEFTSVLVGGIFLVPPSLPNEHFPGAQIFFDEKELRGFNRGIHR